MNDVVKINQVPSPITPMDMLQKAVESGAELDKLEKLMDLQDRWEKNSARKEYVTAMTGFRAGCPSIDKTRKAHNSKYAGLAETIEQIKSLLSECGLSHSWRIEQKERNIIVTCIVIHISGHSEETSLGSEPDTSGSIKGIQGIASTVSYLERYTLYAILGLASKDMDNDGNKPLEFITPEQIDQLQKLTETKGKSVQSFCKFLNISSLAALPKSRFNEAMQVIK